MGLDIRIPLGMIFLIIGGIMSVFGLFTRHSALYDRSLGINLNLTWGLLMFVFGAFMVFHVYCSILVDVNERNGELSSIVTGYKANVLEGETPRDDPARLAG